ncbi:MAG: hypothetical protein FWE80_07060 [Oscillospiraceae bacterium]|nr:hypothetical protein [Oscillospiraceae bacterium]
MDNDISRPDTSHKSGKRWFWTLAAVNLALMLADGLLTRYNTPDLALEGNPLVTLFGFGWLPLTLVNLLFFAGYVATIRYPFLRYRPPALPYRQYLPYASMLYFGRPDRPGWLIWRLPKNWKPVWAMCGFAFGFAAPAGRLVVVLEWIGYLTGGPLWQAYLPLRTEVIWLRTDVVVAAAVTVVAMGVWVWRDFAANRRRLAELKMDN